MDAIDPVKTYESADSPVQEVIDPVLADSGIRLLMKRDDLIHEHISGNKWRKLKYNLEEAVQQEHHTVLTFGGAFSNHIAATAFACHKAGLESIGVIRGEDDPYNPTLQFVREHGMRLHFVSREEYRERYKVEYWDMLKKKFGRTYIVPEGGANALGVKGCTEILPEVEEHFDVVCCAAGTGTTLAGLALTLQEGQRLMGFSALKGGSFLNEEVERLIGEFRRGSPDPDKRAYFHTPLGADPRTSPRAYFHTPLLVTDYHFGGYAKMKRPLYDFIKGFVERTGIPIDPIYTGKMMYGIYDMILNRPTAGADRQGEKACHGTSLQEGSTVLIIHTGGLQGWKGMLHRGLI